MRNSSNSSRISSRSPSPSPIRSSSKKSQSKLPHSPSNVDDQISSERFFAFIRYLGKHVFIVVLSIIFGIFSGLSHSSLLHFIGRIILLIVILYLINLVFYKKGAQVLTETFFTAFLVISATYFVVTCPFDYFIPSLIFMVFCSYLYYIL